MDRKIRRLSVLKYRVVIDEDMQEEKSSVQATVKLEIRDSSGQVHRCHEAGEGNGPVNAVDMAIRKAIRGFYPSISNIRLVDFTVRKVNGFAGTDVPVEVEVVSSDGHKRWTTTAISANIIRASIVAVVEGLEKELEQV